MRDDTDRRAVAAPAKAKGNDIAIGPSAVIIGIGLLVGGSSGIGAAGQDPWDSSPAKAWAFILVAGALIVATDQAIGLGLNRLFPGEPRAAPSRPRLAVPPRMLVAGVVGAGVLVATLAVWAFPVVHGVAILFWVYPLVTWMPLLAGLAAVAFAAAIGVLRGRGAAAGARAGQRWRAVAVASFWGLAMIALPSLQGRALFEATHYGEGAVLPSTTQPRLLPKEAAKAYGNAADLRDAHLVVDPVSGALVFSAEHKAGASPRGPSDGIVLQPLDRIDGTLERRPAGFRTAVAAVGSGALTWRAYRRHPFTRVLERVIVPLGGSSAVAVAPYIGFKGFPVRHPFWQGVYVLHQDGRLEDLSPREAIARPELAAAGHVFPETLARDIAEAYGYRAGLLTRLHRDRTVISDPKSTDDYKVGNPQPYLTNLGDGRVRWVTIAHPASDDGVVSAVFLTDGVTGRTEVWHAPAGSRALSNGGAIAVASRLHVKWTKHDFLADEDEAIRRATEPRAVFLRGRLYYVVSIVPANGLRTPQPVDRTVVIDALQRRIVRVFDHADPEADDALRDFFGARAP